MRIKNHLIAWSLATCMLPGAAWALQLSAPQSSGGPGQGLGYNYIGGQLGYGNTDPDGPAKGDGALLGLNGSLDVIPHINVLGHYNHTFGDDFDTDMLSVGGGYHTSLNINSPVRLDAFGNASLEYINFDSGHGSDDDFGLGVRAGLRAKFEPRIEAEGSVGYVDYGSEDGPVFRLGGVYDLTDNLGLTADYRHFSMDHFDIDQLLFGVRYYFYNY